MDVLNERKSSHVTGIRGDAIQLPGHPAQGEGGGTQAALPGEGRPHGGRSMIQHYINITYYIQWTLPKSNLHKSTNHLSRRPRQVLFSIYSIVFLPHIIHILSTSVFLLDTSYYRAFCHQHHPASPRILPTARMCFLLSNKIRGDAGWCEGTCKMRWTRKSRIIKVTDQVARCTALCYVMYCLHHKCIYVRAELFCFTRIIRYLALFLLKIVPRIHLASIHLERWDDGSPRITAHHPLPDVVSTEGKMRRCYPHHRASPRITPHHLASPRIFIVQ